MISMTLYDLYYGTGALLDQTCPVSGFYHKNTISHNCAIKHIPMEKAKGHLVRL